MTQKTEDKPFEYISHHSNKHVTFHFERAVYDQEIPRSQTADNFLAPRGRAT